MPEHPADGPDPASTAAAADLVAHHPYHRHRWYDRLGLDVADGLDRRAGAAFTAADTQVLAAVDGSVVGATTLTANPFERDVLGVGVARCSALCAVGDRRDVLVRLGRAVLERSADDGHDLVIARIDADDLDALVALQEVGFSVADAGAAWLARGQAIEVHAPPGTTVEVLGARALASLPASELASIIDDAGRRFRTSHFHADPRLDPDRCDELHRRWAEASVRGRWSDGAVLVRAPGRVVGFASYREVALPAPGSGEPVRVRTDWFSLASSDAPPGTGSALRAAALAGADLIEFTVQHRSPYAGLFARTGAFGVLASYYTLHGWTS